VVTVAVRSGGGPQLLDLDLPPLGVDLPRSASSHHRRPLSTPLPSSEVVERRPTLLGLNPPPIDLNPRRLTPRSASASSTAQEGATIEVECTRGLPSRSALRRARMRSSRTGMVRKISEEGNNEWRREPPSSLAPRRVHRHPTERGRSRRR
jgi:hypothetical protein